MWWFIGIAGCFILFGVLSHISSERTYIRFCAEILSSLPEYKERASIEQYYDRLRNELSYNVEFDLDDYRVIKDFDYNELQLDYSLNEGDMPYMTFKYVRDDIVRMVNGKPAKLSKGVYQCVIHLSRNYVVRTQENDFWIRGDKKIVQLYRLR